MNQESIWKILLIDDEPDIRDVTASILQDSGYTVFTAADGETGLDLCRKEPPHIVITDIRMPGINGLQVLESLKQTMPDIEVIVVTAFGDIENAVRALQLDASDFITKPIDDTSLHLALKRATERYANRKALTDYTALLEKENAETGRQLAQIFSFQKNLIENSMDGILAFDETGYAAAYNKSMAHLLGYTAHTVLHRMKLEDFFAHEDRLRFLSDLKSNKFGGPDRLFLYETSLTDNSDSRIPVQVSASVLKDRNRESGLVCFFRDLREIRRLERELTDQAQILHQDKMMSLGRLAASIVHEINNPLSGILNYLRLMLRIIAQGSLTPEHRQKFQRYLEIVENETSRCSQIISGLLAFSRKSETSFTQIRVDELLERSLMLTRHKLELSNIVPELSVDNDIPPVLGDFNQLHQSLINLIFNAIDAMPDGGKLKLETSHDTDQKTVNIRVIDTGTGIEPENLPHIFEPFFSTKKEGYGVGLGLSTVYGIIEHHNGTIRVESQPGNGTVFTISLPVYGS